MALTAYSALIIVQNATILLEARHLTWMNGAVVGGSLVAFAVLMGLAGSSSSNASYGVLAHLVEDARFWLTLPLLVVGCLAPVLGGKMAALHFASPADLPLSERMALKRGSSGAEVGGVERPPFLRARSARRAKKDF
jgi:hypothetical protein